MQYTAWSFFWRKDCLLSNNRTMSQDVKQNNAQMDHTDFQVHEVVSKAQTVSLISLGLHLQSGKPFLTLQHNTPVICTSFGAGASSRFSALCQDDHTSFSSSDVLFYLKALSKQILRGFYPLVSGHPPFQPSLQWFSSSASMAAQLEIWDTSPRAASPMLSGKDRVNFCITFYSKLLQIHHCIPEMLLVC